MYYISPSKNRKCTITATIHIDIRSFAKKQEHRKQINGLIYL